jgi:hypothetical protein
MDNKKVFALLPQGKDFYTLEFQGRSHDLKSSPRRGIKSVTGHQLSPVKQPSFPGCQGVIISQSVGKFCYLTVRARATFGSMRTAGPIVEVMVTRRTKKPLAAAGLALRMASISAEKFS